MTFRINWPDNPVLHGVSVTVIDRPARDEVLVRLDERRPEFDNYEDTRRGCVTVLPEHLEDTTITKE